MRGPPERLARLRHGFVAGNQLSWNLLSNDWFTVANGVYLYVITGSGTL